MFEYRDILSSAVGDEAIEPLRFAGGEDGSWSIHSGLVIKSGDSSPPAVAVVVVHVLGDRTRL